MGVRRLGQWGRGVGEWGVRLGEWGWGWVIRFRHCSFVCKDYLFVFRLYLFVPYGYLFEFWEDLFEYWGYLIGPVLNLCLLITYFLDLLLFDRFFYRDFIY
jgi:hypothetical protein